MLGDPGEGSGPKKGIDMQSTLRAAWTRQVSRAAPVGLGRAQSCRQGASRLGLSVPCRAPGFSSTPARGPAMLHRDQ